MDHKQAIEPTPSGLGTHFFRVKPGAAALAATVLVALISAQLVIASPCNVWQHGFSYSAPVPCQNATCLAWEYAIPSTWRYDSGKPTCTKPSGIAINKVTVRVVSTQWSHCASASDELYPACNEKPASCATYGLYGDNACTVFCQTSNTLPTYCGHF